MSAAASAPLAAQERVIALDVIRGFALFGIFLVNIEWFSRPWQELGQGLQAGTGALDHAVDWAVYLAARGKFWVLFSLLFGMGFAVMSERFAAGGRDFVAPYLRRSAALLLFGLAHVALLWSGDILHAYALAALGLLATRSLRPRTQLALGLAIYVGFALLACLPEAPSSPATAAGRAVEAAKAASVYAQGGFGEISAQRLRDFFTVLLPHDRDNVPLAFAVFLCGAWFVRSGRMRDVAAHARFFASLALAGLALGAALTAAMLLGPQALAGGLLLLGSLATALGYLGGLAWLLARPGRARLIAWLAPAGRMALTNYLLQSLVASLLFYGYGLALWGRVGRTGQVLLVIAMFAAQVLLSRWWLARFRFGPMEWLWRWATYGRRPSLRLPRA